LFGTIQSGDFRTRTASFRGGSPPLPPPPSAGPHEEKTKFTLRIEAETLQKFRYAAKRNLRCYNVRRK